MLNVNFRLNESVLARFAVIPVLFFSVFFSSCVKSTAPAQPKAVRGVIDLTRWDLIKGGNLRLDGEWEFYWSKLLLPSDFSNREFHQKPVYLEVPNDWNASLKYPPHGYATYRLLLRTGDRSEDISVYCKPFLTSYRLYIGGVLVASNGLVGTNPSSCRPQYRTLRTGFRIGPGTTEIILQVSDFSARVGGFWNSLTIGSKEGIDNLWDRNFRFDLYFMGALTIMALYHIGMFLMRRKDQSSLFFSLVCLVCIARIPITNGILLTNVFPGFPWQAMIRIEYMTVFLGSTAMLGFIYHLFPGRVHPVVFRIVGGISLLFVLFILFTDTTVFTKFISAFQSLLILTGIYIIFILIRRLGKDNISRIIFSGLAILFLTVINDVIYSYVSFHPFGYLISWGLFLFIFMQSVALSARFSKSFSKEEELSANLENIVEIRTKELNNAMHELRERNLSMEEELKMARQIQMNMIPPMSSSANIAFYYKPMEQVGGDFFDFIHYNTDGTLGIFISDVSGHGVPAAFITSMIKTSLLQITPGINTPSLVLRFLNDILRKQAAGYFITAFYGIYNPSTHEFNYSNAGHNLPYIVASTGIEQLLQVETGFPLAIMSSNELQTIGKDFSNRIIRLEKGAKLLLYTDGLVEAVNARDILSDEKAPDFGMALLPELLARFEPLPPREFLNSLSKELIRFRGLDDFEDDVCIICIQIE
jgi:serine phosphatase RsbU (regulator of sigma subunit)